MRFLNWLLIILGFGVVILAVWFFLGGASDPLADWGDAPDPDEAMDTGYYAPTPVPGLPGVLLYANAGVPARFPTDNVGLQGPYMVDVDEFWIGRFASAPFLFFPGIGLVPPGAPLAADIPSLEEGAYDDADPDGPSNLETLPPSPRPNQANCDVENGDQLTGFGLCSPVPPYSMAMNGRLVIWIVPGSPPLAFFLTRIWFAGSRPLEGVFWNALFDIDQSGEWKGGGGHIEWVVQDQVVPYSPPSQLVMSPVFTWGHSGRPFGRLLFPVWARSMVSDAPVATAVGVNPIDYRGEGPAGGFAMGEVEDYFIEWRPMGRMLPNPAPGGGGPSAGGGGAGADPQPGPDARGEGLAEALPRFGGPDSVAVGASVALPSEGVEPAGVGLACVPGGAGVVSGAADLPADGGEVRVCADETMAVTGAWVEGTVLLQVEAAPVGAVILVVGSRGEEEELGTGQVPVHGGKALKIVAGEAAL